MVESIHKIQNLLRSKEKLSWEDVSWLEIQAKNYPYFQTLHVWIAKHYLNEEHLLKDHKIQAASTFAVDRNGTIWIGSETAGLKTYNKNNHHRISF